LFKLVYGETSAVTVDLSIRANRPNELDPACVLIYFPAQWMQLGMLPEEFQKKWLAEVIAAAK
jgi:hypothetical protein